MRQRNVSGPARAGADEGGDRQLETWRSLRPSGRSVMLGEMPFHPLDESSAARTKGFICALTLEDVEALVAGAERMMAWNDEDQARLEEQWAEVAARRKAGDRRATDQ